MKRDNRGAPLVTVQRWSRPPPLSCMPCREKKRRCDRGRPCSSCSQRAIVCEYAGEENYNAGLEQDVPRQPGSADEIFSRLRKLEEAVFTKPEDGDGAAKPDHTPFGSHRLPTVEEPPQSMAHLVKQLPPVDQARKLFDHFAIALHPSHNTLHIPWARDIMEKTYQSISRSDEEPSIVNLLLLFSIFAGAAIAWSRDLLKELESTQENAKAVFKMYTRLAMDILNDDREPIAPSTVALVATATLAHVLLNSDDGFPFKVHTFRNRCYVMARAMEINRLDTAKNREERRRKGCNKIEIEIQRRVWWNMVGSDWLSAFSGRPHEGAYTFHPKHMNVHYPANADDALITESGEIPELPLSVPTEMSSFIQRLKLADICREIVDAMPSLLEECRQPDYNVVLNVDRRLRDYLEQLPVFFRMDPESIRQSEGICEQRPNIAWLRTSLHFSVHARICRLHRPYHLERSDDPRYADSRNACIRSAYKTLELRRIMDEQATGSVFRPERFWVIMHHVLMAALTLANDVSFNPGAPDAEARKEKVMATYRILERSQEESSVLVNGIQRNMQTLMDSLQTQRRRASGGSQEETAAADSQARSGSTVNHHHRNGKSQDLAATENAHTVDFEDIHMPDTTALANDGTQLGGRGGGNENWDKLWSEFLAAAPDLDAEQWTSLLGDIDADFQFGLG